MPASMLSAPGKPANRLSKVWFSWIKKITALILSTGVAGRLGVAAAIGEGSRLAIGGGRLVVTAVGDATEVLVGKTGAGGKRVGVDNVESEPMARRMATQAVASPMPAVTTDFKNARRENTLPCDRFTGDRSVMTRIVPCQMALGYLAGLGFGRRI